MSDRIPENGDIVIHGSGAGSAPAYTLGSVPGPDQLHCSTRQEAESLARPCAQRLEVDLWLSDDAITFTPLARFR